MNLCWKHGETAVRFWHGFHEGYAHRKPPAVSRFDAMLFDLFDTLVVFERDRLPEVSVNGRRIRSTAGRVHGRLAERVPGIELGAFVDALVWSWQEAERIRGPPTAR